LRVDEASYLIAGDGRPIDPHRPDPLLSRKTTG
jgi:hypothetical protein